MTTRITHLLLLPIIIAAATMLLQGFTYTSAEEEVLLTPEQMKENLKFMRDRILERFPDPYHAISKEEYIQLYKEVQAEFDRPMKPLEFYFKANRIVMALKDAHTRMGYGHHHDPGWLPLRMIWVPDGLGIEDAPDYPQLEKSRVISIEGVSVDEWLDRLGTIKANEGVAYVRFFGIQYIRAKWVHIHFSDDPEIKGVTIEAEKDGDRFEVFVPFVMDEKWIKVNIHDPLPDGAHFTYKYLDELSAGYFELTKCQGDYKYFEALDEFMAEIKKRGYKNLIFDLRRNGGGVSSVIYGLMKHMPGDKFFDMGGQKNYGKMSKFIYASDDKYWYKSEKEKALKPFEGKVYILVSQETFSAANDFAILFQDNNLATIVGQETSNAPCCYGATKLFILPYSAYTISVSNTRFIRPSKKCDTSGVVPDVEIPLMLNDVFSGRDPVMEWLGENLK